MPRKLEWNRIRSPKDWFAFLIATVLGAGLLPRMPGTFGTIFAIPIVYYTIELPLETRLVFWGSLLLLGIWAAQHFDRKIARSQDHQSIVVDEVLGYAITSWTLGPHIPQLLLAFVIFRFFDIFKLPPVRAIDRWSHRSKRWSGLGVIADDLVAGLQGLIVILILQKLYLLDGLV